MQKPREGFLPQVLHPSPRNNTRKGQKPAEEPRPSDKTCGRVTARAPAPHHSARPAPLEPLAPRRQTSRALQKTREGFLPRVLHPSPGNNTRKGQKPAEEPRPSDETRGREPAQRQNPRKSDSQGPALLRAAAPLAKPPAETRGKKPFRRFCTLPRETTRGTVRNPQKNRGPLTKPTEETLPLLSARQRASTSRSGRATRTHPRPATRPLGNRAAARANPPGALGLWR